MIGKYLLIHAIALLFLLLLTGCSAFDIQYAERIICDNGRTPWASEVVVTTKALYWYNHQAGWRSRAVNGSKKCRMEILDVEKWHACTGIEKKCKMIAKR